jgi:hypothetical protein
MAESKTDQFKKRMTVKDREEKALAFYNQIKEYLGSIRINTVLLALAMKEIQERKYWHELDCVSFEMFCCLPEVSMKPDTVKKYIKIVSFYTEKKIDTNKIMGMPINKLDILRGTKKPEEWLEPARELGFSDLRKSIKEKEHGINIEQEEVDSYTRRKEKAEQKKELGGCPHWDIVKQDCLKGVCVK